MLHIKADEALFNRWRNLARRINGLAAIVQNDMLTSEADLNEWKLDAYMMRDKLVALIAETEAHCQRHATEAIHCWGGEEEMTCQKN